MKQSTEAHHDPELWQRLKSLFTITADFRNTPTTDQWEKEKWQKK